MKLGLLFLVTFPSLFLTEDNIPARWNLVPKRLLKKLCNLDESLAICEWKRHLPRNSSKKPVFSKWRICRDHPELNICKWQNGGLAPTTQSSVDGFREEKESIFAGTPDMMLSSKWTNKEDLDETVRKELQENPRFDGQLRQETSNESKEQIFDESIMTADTSRIFQL
ncbi:unnamed protein product [Caenorhabditis angaria]|uniref:Uncharacterized protein n=1 Tax=Caenorhabditis angaria TaxID=860376 RepID=A0A9P1MZ41_9PELO|nr:unnamed protein product [Caenorhabditis angaria]